MTSRRKRLAAVSVYGCILALALLSCTTINDRTVDDGAGRGETAIDRSFQVCPDELTDDVLHTLGLEQVRELTLVELEESVEQLGFYYEADRYGAHPTNQCQDLKDLDPNTPVMHVIAGRDQSGEFARAFVVVSNPSGLVTHIEARYTYDGP